VLSEEIETIEDVYEPFLLRLGFIDRTPQGRIATDLARQHLAGLGFEIPPPRRGEADMPSLWADDSGGVAEPAVAGEAGGSAAAVPAAGRPSMPPRSEPRPMRFTVEATAAAAPASGMRARLGRLELPHGVVETPQFMPVGTNATVKALDPGDLEAAGASIVLANTYHLFLRPGHERIERLGGLHRFMGWDHPIPPTAAGGVLADAGHRTDGARSGATRRLRAQ
jgi:hypothetical protein